MTAITKDFIEINLSTDELMLKELERRDGIYSFIFHELEVPKEDTPTPSISPAKIMDSNYVATTTAATTTSTTGRASANTGTDSCSLPDDFQIKTESVLIQPSDTVSTSNNATTTTTTKTLVCSSPTPASFAQTFPSMKCPDAAVAVASIAPTAIIVPSRFASTSSSTTAASAAINGIGATLPCIPSLSGVSMRSYHEYLKTWHPPPSLVYDNTKLFAYMADCGFRVRAPTPRFSHISAPLVRNRRHALKETPEYKRMSDLCMCAPVADLRALFPLDPDVHAPFAATVDVVTSTTLVDGGHAVDGCCSDEASQLIDT